MAAQDQDYPMGSPEEYEYSAASEPYEYWHSDPPPVSDEISPAVIDPRLYGNDMAADIMADSLAQADEFDYGAIEYAASDREITPDLDAGEDDSDFNIPGSESDDEDFEDDDEDDEEDDEDEDDSDRERRRRRGGGRFSGRYGARGRKGVKRGPRKPLEPGPEFKMLHSEATEAFIDGDYDRAKEKVTQAILKNPEIFPAHSLLAEIFLAQGQMDKAFLALFNGAHTRPKDASVWLKVSRYILRRAGQERERALNDVIYCYTRVLDIEPKNTNVRYQRAAIYRELGLNGKAAIEYERILKDRPHNPRPLRHLAEVYIELKNVQRALDIWNESMAYYRSLDPSKAKNFSWSEVNIYVELFSYVEQYEQGIEALKSLSRWLLNRGEDRFWDGFDADDREWDIEDSPRRIKTNGFIPGTWPSECYGAGLPLELRIKLGLFRLKMGHQHYNEALHHFEFLMPDVTSEGAPIFDYGDLFREVADALKEHRLLAEAYRFYYPIQETAEHADIGYYMAMADCCLQLEMWTEAESYYLTVADNDHKHIESRIELAKLYEELDETEKAFKSINEAIRIGREDTKARRRGKDTRLEQLAAEFKAAEPGATDFTTQPTASLTTYVPPARNRVREESNRVEDAQYLFAKMQALDPYVQGGDEEALEDWLDIADALLRDFRSNRVFYPNIREEFQGFHKKPGKAKKDYTALDRAQEVADRLQKAAGPIVPEEPASDTIPDRYYEISFDDWLDIFLQYSLRITDQGEIDEAYDTLYAAANASVFFHSKPKARLIHVCWFTCALRVQDDETLATVARWFIKEYQFVTDTYRLFSMLSRLCGNPLKPHFHSSQHMKFMLRQVKAIDFTLPDSAERPQLDPTLRWKDRASLTTKDENGELVPAESLDIAVLVLYGHILYSGGSFYPALNYFFRAYALDDENPVVLLSIALCYIHHSLKRQSDNRHYLISQGLAFMREYRQVRTKPGVLLVERQEMEFNQARVWHGLGLLQLAVNGYEKVLAIGEEIKKENPESSLADRDVDMEGDNRPQHALSPRTFVENFSCEAAYGLQNIHGLSGNSKAAMEVTERYLVI
ncbi:hypothetical protein N7468_000903 [Penicillium chermesinum]|uniref:Uncharacterized protein n=1 Tax=Penicillium chermesinum TaxID=63820 RepID=A0A9W9TW96_9EURO|nr:uncharacterized protein N7468_000903 [Penicillium chermesinum]KAJ5245920.1 hypothetical protein N7468_000903 [Penicillium chermesinum]KAJ6144218.1 hypothetical protein N7470_008113 [Penicillium chermesinum]